MSGLAPLSPHASRDQREDRYQEVLLRIEGLLAGEDDPVAAMATVTCELHHAFEWFHWTGFYRMVRPGLLVIGPYQGGHGCLRIELPRGVCGAAAAHGETQLVDDVEAFPGHIACSATTRSEIVVPIVDGSGAVLGVLDVDSDLPAAFGDIDRRSLETLADRLGRRFPRL